MIKTEYVTVQPPVGLIQLCTLSPYTGGDNGEALAYLTSGIQYLRQCNTDNLEAYEGLRNDTGTEATPVQ